MKSQSLALGAWLPLATCAATRPPAAQGPQEPLTGQRHAWVQRPDVAVAQPQVCHQGLLAQRGVACPACSSAVAGRGKALTLTCWRDWAAFAQERACPSCLGAARGARNRVPALALLVYQDDSAAGGLWLQRRAPHGILQAPLGLHEQRGALHDEG